MPRYFIFLQYKGSHYHGWQNQPNAITVQQVLEEKLSILLKEKVETTGCGRTDTGVHAKEFVAHFDTESTLPKLVEHFLYKINCLLPGDISVYNLIEVTPQAHARFDAISRTYEYYITTSKDPFNTEFAFFYPWSLNIELMNKAAGILLQYTDFTSFSKLHTDVKTNNCKISEACWKVNGNKLVFTITADRFLRNMVRAIVGTLIDVGKEKIDLSQFCNILDSKNRSYAGVSVPPQGLFLTKILYPSALLK
jgi:tRNA pseudouridine38-40 synthase